MVILWPTESTEEFYLGNVRAEGGVQHHEDRFRFVSEKFTGLSYQAEKWFAFDIDDTRNFGVRVGSPAFLSWAINIHVTANWTDFKDISFVPHEFLRRKLNYFPNARARREQTKIQCTMHNQLNRPAAAWYGGNIDKNRRWWQLCHENKACSYERPQTGSSSSFPS